MRVFPLLIWLTVAFTSISNGQSLSDAAVQKAKAASVLIITDQGAGTGFCVNSEIGIFITNHHVIEGARTIRLVANSGEADEQSVDGSVLRLSDDSDLAVITANFEKPVPALKFGDDAKLSETQSVTVFGYPFGMLLAAKDERPAISVNVGRVTSLRKEKGVLRAIQTDATINPGNSGGAMLDSNGDVVGIVVAGITGAQVNFAIPASDAKKLVSEPIIKMTPSADDLINFGVKNTFHFTVLSMEGENVADEVVLKIGKQSFGAKKDAEGEFRVVVPAVKDPAAIKLPLSLTVEVKKGGKLVLSREGKFSRLFVRGADSPTKPVIPDPAGGGPPLDENDNVISPPYDISKILDLVPGHDHVGKSEIRFDAPISQLAVGGHGRFLVFYYPSSKEIKVFDCATLTMSAKAVKFGSGICILTAGENEIFAIDLVAGSISAISLTTLDILRTAKLPRKRTPFFASMGRSGRDMVIISYLRDDDNGVAVDQPLFFNARKMAPYDINFTDVFPFWRFRESHVRTSADGNVMTLISSSESTGASIMGGSISYTDIEFDGHKEQFPTLTGAHILSSNAKLQKTMGNFGASFPYEPDSDSVSFPSGHPSFFCQLNSPEESEPTHKISLVPYGETLPLITVDDPLEEMIPLEVNSNKFRLEDRTRVQVDPYSRFHFVPQLRLLLTIPPSNDRIVVRTVDLEQEISAQNDSYLCVSSHPKTAIQGGEQFRYQVEAFSRGDVLTYELIEGPEGMSVSETGEVTWEPGPESKGGRLPVSLRVTDENHLSKFQSFHLFVR